MTSKLMGYLGLRTLAFVAALATLLLWANAARAEQTFTDRVHVVLLDLQPWHGDSNEESEARSERLRGVAAAVSSGTQHAMCVGAWKDSPDCHRAWTGSRRELTAALVTIGYWETAYASAIQLGRCDLLPGGCDHDRAGVPRARSYWQCWKSACPQLWQTEPGSDAELHTAAWEASKLLAYFYGYCRTLSSHDPWELAFTAYAGRGCKPWGIAARRRGTMVRLLAKL